ncbi:MurT ligase domain-containing protein [Herpetosiphon gulosus]|uniref:Lipid II isoglutaminyl synthase (glutamine-hydrolyzing) subunit MurT n=1 Tax=Herpetosiphon gulosus TaxID=1973496 RepID=A0ABP9X346_9CHLR
MTIREHVGLSVAQLAQWASRQFGFGGGTNLPGRIARWVAPNVLRHQTKRLTGGVVLVSGTNGKTTTSRMIAAICSQQGQPALHNRAGANLITGLTAATLDLGIWGQPDYQRALFEVDEAHLPAAIAETQPRVVLLLNLFRDQLDRYGEVDTLAAKWQKVLATLPSSSTVVLNADDPAVADLATGLQAKVLFYGLEDVRHGNDALRHAADSIFCRRCGQPYQYEPAYYGHIGRYHCPACGHRRPEPQISLRQLELDGTRGSILRVVLEQSQGQQALELNLPLPGLYNALNALAAIAATSALDIPLLTIRNALEQFSAAFGRIERFEYQQKQVLMALIKNPIGASETVRMITNGSQTPLNLLIAINDKIADGTDVSWLWDADFEALVGHTQRIVVSGTRAADMANRLKYAGIEPQQLQVEPDLAQAFDLAIANDVELTLLPTYTAMLEMREVLVDRGVLKPFWES